MTELSNRLSPDLEQVRFLDRRNAMSPNFQNLASEDALPIPPNSSPMNESTSRWFGLVDLRSPASVQEPLIDAVTNTIDSVGIPTGGSSREIAAHMTVPLIRRIARASLRSQVLAAGRDQFRNPSLRRSLASLLANWTSGVHELCGRLARDYDKLVPPGASVVSMTSGLGDPHNGGRMVSGVAFSNGESWIYKPRSLHFDALLDALHDLVSPAQMRISDRIELGDYGWVRKLETMPLRDSQVDEYFFRVGVLLGSLSTLGASDIHEGNLLSVGDQPVVLDCETFLDPVVKSCSPDIAARVSLIGMLPGSIVDRSEAGSLVDFSALARHPENGRTAPRSVLREVAPDETGQRRLGLRRSSIPRSEALPVTVSGTQVRAAEHLDSIISGFQQTMFRVTREAESVEQLLYTASEAYSRVVVRDTAVYGTLWDETSHPSFAGGSKRDSVIWAMLRQSGLPLALVESENRQLQSGDTPYFTVAAGQTELRAGDGTRIQGFFKASGLSLAHDALRAVSSDSIARASNGIINSISATDPRLMSS